MAVNIEIRPATMEHVRAIAPMLREADRLEAEAATGLSAERALELSLRLADDPAVGLLDGELISIWGCNPVSVVMGIGAPWMLGTPTMEKRAKHWLPVATTILKDMGKQYSVLENYVDARNKKSMRWLKSLGFHFDEARPYGPYGIPFHRFEGGL